MSKSPYIDAEFFYGASPEIFKRAAELRAGMTEPERMLWNRLKGKQVNGLRFRRQHPIAKYIVDFYCHRCRLVIEIDGGVHLKTEVRENDKEREANLIDFGLQVIRFTNQEIENNIEEVVNIITESTKVPQLGDLGGKN